jgi:predicted nucleic acid-binding protein
VAFDDIYRGYVLVDTSALIALIDKHDQNHSCSTQALTALTNDVNVRLFVCNLTIYETYTRLRYDRDWVTAKEVWNTIAQVIKARRIEFVSGVFEEKTRDILKTYRFQKLSFHDAGCAALMLENKIGRIFSFDSDFDIVGFERFPSLS